jgi:hypothetical protein
MKKRGISELNENEMMSVINALARASRKAAEALAELQDFEKSDDLHVFIGAAMQARGGDTPNIMIEVTIREPEAEEIEAMMADDGDDSACNCPVCAKKDGESQVVH